MVMQVNPGTPATVGAIYNNVYFGSMLLGGLTVQGAASTMTDRLGTATAGYPYGTDISGQTAQFNPGPIDFATYLNDSSTGLEYANQRWYSAGYGRFFSADPSSRNVRYGNPASWNRFAYSNGDPANGNDPGGLGTVVCIQGTWDGEGYTGDGLTCNDIDGDSVSVSAYADPVIEFEIDVPSTLGSPDYTPTYYTEAWNFTAGASSPNHGVNCSQPPLGPPKAPPGANVDANVANASHLSQAAWLNDVRPNGIWDYAPQNGQAYAAFGNFSFGATCAAFFSLSGCQGGAGLAAFATAARNVLVGGRWTAGPGNTLVSARANGVPIYGDQSQASENLSVIARYYYTVWRRACQS